MEKLHQKMSISHTTKSYTLEDILEEIEEDVKILSSLGIKDVEKNEYQVCWGSEVKAYGCCTYLGTNSAGGKIFTISINKKYVEVAPSKDVHNTIMHECIHSVDGCMNHGSKWKAIAQQVNENFIFTPITRTGSCAEYQKVIAAKFKYQATCENCKKSWHWMRKGRIYRACLNGTAICSCGGRKFICTELF